MKKILPLFLVLLAVSHVSGTEIESESVTVDLESSIVNVDIEVEELTSSKFTYLTSYPINSAKAKINRENADCETRNLEIGSEIQCEVPRKSNLTVNLSFRGSGFVESRQGNRVFSYSQSFYRPTSSYSLKVLLPKGSGILDRSNISTPVVSPPGGKIGSNGRRISVSWERKPRLGSTVDFQVAYEKFSQPLGMNYLAGIGLASVLLVIISYLVYKRIIVEDIENIYDELSEDEVAVLDAIRDEDGEMLQKDVVEASDYSKAKISSVVSDLVEKNILKKEKKGRSNSLSIAKKYRV